MTRVAAPSPGLILAILAASIVTAFVMATLADASFVWSLLLLLGLAALSVLAWLPELKAPLLAIFVFTLPVDISKALTADTTIYGAGIALYLHDVAFLPLLAIWATDKLRETGRSPRLTTVHTIFLVQTGWLLFEASRSYGPGSYYLFINNLKCVLYFLILADLARDPRLLRAILFGALAGLAAQLAMATLQLLTGSALHIEGAKSETGGENLVFEEAGGVHFHRLTGFLPHPNAFSDYLTFLLPPKAAVLLLGRRALGAVWFLLMPLALWALVALTLAMSRGGWVATGVAFVFILVTGWRSGLVNSRQMAGVALGAVLAVGVVATIFPQAIYRITNNDEKSGATRLVLMDQAMLIISEHPIVGVGLGGYNQVAKTTTPPSFADLDPQYRKVLRGYIVHNKYLLTFAEFGVIGMIIFILMLWSAIRIPFRTTAWKSSFQYALSLGLAGAVVAQSVFYLFEHFSYDVRLSMLYVAAGVLVAVADPNSHSVRNARAVSFRAVQEKRVASHSILRQG